MSSLTVNTSKDGDPTTSLGNLWQCSQRKSLLLEIFQNCTSLWHFSVCIYLLPWCFSGLPCCSKQILIRERMFFEREDRSVRKRELRMRCSWLQEQCKMLKVKKKEQKTIFSPPSISNQHIYAFMMEFLKMLNKIRRNKQHQEAGDRVIKMKVFIAIYS